MDIDQTDYEGRTALMLCTAQGRREAAEALIRRGADVNALYWYHGRKPNTPLDAAVQTRRTDLADTLRAHGALSGRELAQRIDEAREHGAEFVNLRSPQFTAAFRDAPVYRRRGAVTGANGGDSMLPAEVGKLSEVTDDGSSQPGAARIIDNPTGQKIGVLAPWGEMQYGGHDAKIAAQLAPGEPDKIGEVRYILDATEFSDYEIAE